MKAKHFFMMLTTASLLVTGQAFAHAMLESSSPKNGATVSVAPKTINLEFGHQAKLTKLKLLSKGKEIPITLDKAAPAATTFSIPLPALAPGKYEVQWGTLGEDGHPMTGKLSFTVSGS